MNGTLLLALGHTMGTANKHRIKSTIITYLNVSETIIHHLTIRAQIFWVITYMLCEVCEK